MQLYYYIHIDNPLFYDVCTHYYYYSNTHHDRGSLPQRRVFVFLGRCIIYFMFYRSRLTTFVSQSRNVYSRELYTYIIIPVPDMQPDDIIYIW